MNLINKLLQCKIDRNVKKRARLVDKLQDVEKEYESMIESLKSSPVHLDFVHKYWEEKISNLKDRIVKINGKIEDQIDKYNQRNLEQ